MLKISCFLKALSTHVLCQRCRVLTIMGLVHSSKCLPLAVEVSTGKMDETTRDCSRSSCVEPQERLLVTVYASQLVDEAFLGKGSFGNVTLVQQRSSCDPSVVRRVALKKGSKEPEHETVANERKILSNLDHPHIIKLYGICEYSSKLDAATISRGQLTEYCSGGELFQLIVSRGALEEDVAKRYFFQIMKALNYLHTVAGVVHRDLKPENLLLTDNFRKIKLCDLGTGVRLNNHPNKRAPGRIGSLSYAAPEVYIESLADYSSDIWSASVVLYVMLCAASPFRSSQDADPETCAINRVKKAEINKERAGWKRMSRQPKKLILKMLNLTSKERPTAGEVLVDQWLEDVDLEKIYGGGMGTIGENGGVKSDNTTTVFNIKLIKTEILRALEQFSQLDLTERMVWLALAQQMSSVWSVGEQIFATLDSNLDGIVDKLDLLMNYKSLNEKTIIDRITMQRPWLGYSEIIAALLLGVNWGTLSIPTSFVDFEKTIPFAFDSIQSKLSSEENKWATYEEFRSYVSKRKRITHSS